MYYKESNIGTVMGIIYLDTFTTSHGLEKKEVYLSFSHEPVTIIRKYTHDPYGPYHPDHLFSTELIEDRMYVLSAHYRIWWDQDAHDMGKPFLQRIKLSIEIEHPDIPLYTKLYDELKALYPHYRDVWEEPHRCSISAITVSNE